MSMATVEREQAVLDPIVTSMRRRACRSALLVLALMMRAGASQGHDQETGSSCAASDGQPEVASARQALERAPRDLEARLDLANVLVRVGCYEQAVHVLEDGQSLHPRDDQLQRQLRTARSLISERQFFDGLDKAELEAKLARHALRCTRFGDVAACDQALALKPNDVAMVLAKGEALYVAGKPVHALEVYERAAALDPSSADIPKKIQAAQTLRATLERRCMSGEGAAALSACESILRKDAPDEFDLTRRVAVLQQAANQPAKALDTYIAANALRRGDKAVALAIVALLDSTGRSDAAALAARGSSLVTLGRTREGIASMRQAQALAPELPGIANQIAAAERLLKQEDRMRESQREAVAGGKPGGASTTAVASVRTYSNVQPASHAN